MKYLNTLSPAEITVIHEGMDASLRDMLKYTLMSLIFRKVLKIEEVVKRPNPRDPVQTYQYVMRDVAYEGYKPAQHEVVFTEPFKEDEASGMLFRNMVKLGYENAEGQHAYQRVIITSPAISGLFFRNIFSKILGGFGYTQAGHEANAAVKKEIREAGDTIVKYMDKEPHKVSDLLKVIGCNIVLLPTFDFAMFKHIDAAFAAEITNPIGDFGDAGCSSWDVFDSFGDSFDSSCGGADGGGDGCSGGGDSGCSGCGGGCSGCGS